MKRWVLFRSKALRFVAVILSTAYIGNFLHISTTSIESTATGPGPEFLNSIQTSLDSPTRVSPPPIHGIVEGQTKVAPGENIWDRSPILPKWIKNYFTWHCGQMRELGKENYRSFRYYLVECTTDYDHCGGTADRLAPIPLHLAIANATNRLLLIHWTKPMALEEFLVPPQGGIDWRVPNWLWQLFESMEGQQTATFEKKMWKFARGKAPLVRVKYQSQDHGSKTYNERIRGSGDPTFQQVYHDLWRTVFTPAPPVARRIEAEMTRMQLVPGTYVAVHLRALYNTDYREENLLTHWAQNAVRCATHFPIRPATMFFASDEPKAEVIAEEYALYNRLKLARRQRSSQKVLHLEKTENWSARKPEEYFDAFVDLYLLGMSQCTAYNMGGFGKWGSYMNYNSNCSFQMKANMIKCDLQERKHRTVVDPVRPPMPLFLPPLDPILTKQEPNSLPAFNDMYISASSALWDSMDELPSWLKDYCAWHHEKREQLSRDNFKEYKFLVMQCLSSDKKCGGTSDRLKPVLTILRLAATTKRFLLIQWSKPCKLEEFLLPPRGGLDWRTPEWLWAFLEKAGVWAVPGLDVRNFAMDHSVDVVRSKYQSFNGGCDWYNDQLVKGEKRFDELYHLVWKILFTPSPPLATAITNEMDHLGLVPFDYSSAHVRALYAVEGRPLKQVENWAANGINCASRLRPGKPIFLASDHKHASDFAVSYGQKLGWPIVTHQSNPNPPLHLDKVDNSTKRKPSDFYDTFIDLYLLAFGGCVTYNKGGYGSWGLLIGGNISCSTSWKRTSKGFQPQCNFSTASFDIAASQRRGPLFLEPAPANVALAS